MAITNPDYNVGTVSITENTKVLTGVGTMWLSADLEKGDQFGFDGYAPARIDTINNDGSITLLDTWRGPTLTTSPYFIRYQADGSGLTGQSVALRRMLSQPLLSAFAGLSAAADKLMYFTGANTMALVDFKGWARSLLGLTPAANKGIYFTDANTAATYDITAQGRAALANITAAGNALIDDVDASAMLTTLGVSTYIKGLLDDANAGAAQTTLGISTFIKALLDDTTSTQAFASLGGSSGAGWMKLPGGLLVQWGTNVNTSDGTTSLATITFATPFATGESYQWLPFNGDRNIAVFFAGYRTAPWPQAAAVAYGVRNSAGADLFNQVHRVSWIAIGIAP